MTAPAPDAPFYADLADGPPGGRVVWLTARDGVRLRVAHWGGGEKGTVALLPGRTECIEKYGRAVKDLALRGFSVIVIDWRGQGLSDRALPDRMKGHVGSFAEYQTDLDAMLVEADRAGLPEPRFLMAHSMGGCIGLRALVRGVPFRAAMFSAPMWGISLASWQRPVAQVVTRMSGLFGQISRYAPSTGPKSYVLDAPFQDNVLTADPQMWDYMRAQAAADPDLSLGGPTLGWLRAALRECGALSVLPAPAIPTICALGTEEKVVDLAPVHRRMAGWDGGKLDLYQNARHEIMMETAAIRARFFDAAAELYEAHSGAKP